MSQVCKYYLRGACKYGPRCHFLHEDPDYKSRGVYSDYSYNNNANRNHYQNYGNRYGHSNRDYSSNYGHRDFSQNFSNKDYAHTYSNRDYIQNYSRNTYHNDHNREHSSYYNQEHQSNYNREHSSNYNRYHVDNRQNQREAKSVSALTSPELLEMIKSELKQFEERHVWPLTVFAPLKNFGNVPGFRDYSPEEVRYQYYEAVQNNSLFEFEQNMKHILKDLVRCFQLFKSGSAEARDVVNTMMLRPLNQNVEEMATDFVSSAASAFSFDLSKLPNSGSSGDAAQNSFPPSVFGTNNVNTSVFPSSDSIPSFPISNQMFPSDNSPQFSIFNSQPSNQGLDIPSQFNSQPQSQINSFSFDLSNLNSDQSHVAPQVANFGVPQRVPDVNEVVYSKIEDLPPNILEAFAANTFTFERIPLVPPPKELCRIAM